MRRIRIHYFNDPVAVGFGRIGFSLNEFLVISFVVSGSLRAFVRLLNYRGRSEQSQLQLIVMKLFGIVASLMLTSIILWDPRLDSLLAHPTGSAQ